MIGKLPGYSIATVFSLSLHGVLLVLIVVGWMPQGRERTVQPRYVQATLVQLEPRKKLVKKAKVSKQSVENERTKKIEKQRAEAKRQESAEQKKKQRALEAKKRKEQLAREKQKKREQQAEEALRREQELAFASALDEEEEYIAAGKDEQLVASYSAYIVERISANWSRPPSARRGMEVALSIQMVPTGRVVSVAVEQSSGNLAFDRSTEQAVYKVERFDKLQELAQSRPQVFEATFRRFRLVFRPDDLRL